MKIMLLTICLILLFCLLGYWTNRQLEVTKESLTIDALPDTLNHARILHVSDIHFGRLRVPHKKLLAAATKEKPDLIFVTGDTIDRTEDVTLSGIQAVINELSKIAPTYVIEGNHETTSGQYEEWRKLMLDSQATLLENQVISVKLKGQPISLIGLKNGITDLPFEEKAKINSEYPAFILAHHPENFSLYLEHFFIYPIKGIFSGHAHGGQIRLPFIDGLLSPNQGFFPKYTNGPYQLAEKPDTTLFVSRGLANSTFPFRINNKPHLISITLKK